MNRNVFITCAVTGGGDTTGKNAHVPVTPEEIAASALGAARAGAAIVHIHARDPETRRNSREIAYFKEIVRLIRNEDSALIINLTGGNGGSWTPSEERPLDESSGDVVGPIDRIAHALEIQPDICTLDCGVMNFGESVYVNTPNFLRTMAQELKRAGIRPELELFDLGHQRIAMELVKEGLGGEVPIYQFCLGVAWGAPATTAAMLVMRDALPPDAIWSGFGLSQWQMPMAAQAVILGGHVRVGLEDNLYIEPKVPARNEQLVERAVEIIGNLGAKVMTSNEARKLLKLNGRDAAR